MARVGWKHTEEAKQKMSLVCTGRTGRIQSDEEKAKRSQTLKGRSFSDEHRKRISDTKKLASGAATSNWKGGVKAKNIALYDTYIGRLSFAEECRRDPENIDRLQVLCTYCGRWINPTPGEVRCRIAGMNGTMPGEYRFYCKGMACRNQCSIYGQRKYPKGYAPATSREVQPELRKMVFHRDGYACQKCGSTERLHCHHMDPVVNNPIESADVDVCVTYCKACHIEAHKQPGCTFSDLRCTKREVI